MSATSSGLGSSTLASAEAVLRDVDDDGGDYDDDGGEIQTEKLVSACDNAVSRLSSPTNDSDPIELDRLAFHDRSRTPDGVEHPSSLRR